MAVIMETLVGIVEFGRFCAIPRLETFSTLGGLNMCQSIFVYLAQRVARATSKIVSLPGNERARRS